MLAGVGRHDPGRDDQVAPSFQKRAPVPIEVRDQLRRGEHRIVTKPSRHGAGMARRADAFDDAMTDIAANPGDDSDRQISRHQDRPLLDVQFQPRREGFRIGQRLSVLDPIDVDADLAHAFGERPIGVGRPSPRGPRPTVCRTARSIPYRPCRTARSLRRAGRKASRCGAAENLLALKPARTIKPATTPAAPSKLPPCGTESRWEPHARNGNSGSEPSRVTTRLAPASRSVRRPSARALTSMISSAVLSPSP